MDDLHAFVRATWRTLYAIPEGEVAHLPSHSHRSLCGRTWPEWASWSSDLVLDGGLSRSQQKPRICKACARIAERGRHLKGEDS